MNANTIQLLLVAITSVLFVVWLLTVQAQITHPYREQPPWTPWVRTLLLVFAAVLVVRTAVVEPSYIPSSSMLPTLLEGDYILVKKYTYGVRPPLSSQPITRGRSPQRGDIVVFYPPRRERGYYVKRVIGLPGDELAYLGGRLEINGEPAGYALVPEEDEYYLGNARGEAISVPLVFEQLPGADRVHRVLLDPNPNLYTFTVPDNRYFMMGDNRGNSEDSRVWGAVEYQQLVGGVSRVWLSKEPGGFFRLDRIGPVH